MEELMNDIEQRLEEYKTVTEKYNFLEDVKMVLEHMSLYEATIFDFIQEKSNQLLKESE